MIGKTSRLNFCHQLCPQLTLDSNTGGTVIDSNRQTLCQSIKDGQDKAEGGIRLPTKQRCSLLKWLEEMNEVFGKDPFVLVKVKSLVLPLCDVCIVRDSKGINLQLDQSLQHIEAGVPPCRNFFFSFRDR